jgi:hypothetical protein
MKSSHLRLNVLRFNVNVKLAGTGALAMFVLALAGCRLDMHEQPKFKPLQENVFYGDKRSSRPTIQGTVARGQLDEDSYFYTGKIDGKDGDVFPFPVTAQVLERGRERYNIYCSPCHSRVGDGNGMIPQRGLKQPPSYHIDRLRKEPDGHFFSVITNGFGAMGDYSAQVPPEDRWAIVAYIRALQLSQYASRRDVPAGVAISSKPPDTAVKNWPPPMVNTKATHGESGGGTINREGKNE